jgi:RNA-directed DNA polymerase
MSYKTRKNEGGESYNAVVPAKQLNESQGGPQEAVEGRALTKKNMVESNSYRTQSRGSEPSGLDRVRKAAKEDRKMKFTALLHHVTIELLHSSYQSLKKQAAAGVDGVTWEEYGGDGLQERLADLHRRIHSGGYHAKPSRRVWIPKADGRQRPLGIAALEDKIAQRAIGTVLEQIWEQDFLDFSYGFRPGRRQHDALDALFVGITQENVNWVLDLDIKSFFDKIEHEWMIRFVEHRIGDRRVVRLIQKWLKAGVMEDGQWFETKEGTPQGSVISPILANLYLHYALDVWTNAWRKGVDGDVIIVRYADDAVLGFQYRQDADRFLEELRERLRKFGMELHPDKTRLIEFGRYAAERRKKRGAGKPETFNFLGFTHICGRSRQTGYFTVFRRTIGQRMAAKLGDIQQQLRKRMHEDVMETGKWLGAVVRGYFQYHAVPENEGRLKAFRNDVLRLWLHLINRRSQRSRWTWGRFLEHLADSLPPAQILHPWPPERYAARHSR